MWGILASRTAPQRSSALPSSPYTRSRNQTGQLQRVHLAQGIQIGAKIVAEGYRQLYALYRSWCPQGCYRWLWAIDSGIRAPYRIARALKSCSKCCQDCGCQLACELCYAASSKANASTGSDGKDPLSSAKDTLQGTRPSLLAWMPSWVYREACSHLYVICLFCTYSMHLSCARAYNKDSRSRIRAASDFFWRTQSFPRSQFRWCRCRATLSWGSEGQSRYCLVSYHCRVPCSHDLSALWTTLWASLKCWLTAKEVPAPTL